MWEHQPRWPRKTPVAPSRRGPGGGRWRDDGKPNKPGRTWAEVASSVIGHAIGRHRGESGHGIADDVRYALRGGHREHGTGHPTSGHEGGGPSLTHHEQMQLDYPSRMRAMGATDADLTRSPEHAPYTGNDAQQLRIRAKYGLPADASPHEIGEAIRHFSTGGRAGSPGRSTHTLEQHGHFDSEGRPLPGETQPRAGTFIGNVPETHGNARPWAERVNDQFATERDTHSGRAAEDAIGQDVYGRLTAPDTGQLDSRLLGHLTNEELTGARDSIAAKAGHPDTSEHADEGVLDRVDQELSRRGHAHPAILQATQHVAAMTAHLRATRRSGDPLHRRAMDHLTAAGHDRASLYEMQRVLRRRGEDHTDSVLTPSMGRAISRVIASTGSRSA